MNKKRIKQVDSFKAITETGETIIIFVHQEFIIVDSFGEPSQEIPGIKILSSSISKHVNVISDNQYEILGATKPILATKV